MNATQTDEERELTENQQQADAQLEGFGALGRMLTEQWNDDRIASDELIEQAQQEEANGVLSVEVERTIKIVLCTGGPHCEVRWPEDSNPFIVCYGWFGAGKYERTLTDDELTGLIHAIGEWEELAEYTSR
jgi:hypothetical protein